MAAGDRLPGGHRKQNRKKVGKESALREAFQRHRDLKQVSLEPGDKCNPEWGKGRFSRSHYREDGRVAARIQQLTLLAARDSSRLRPDQQKDILPRGHWTARPAEEQKRILESEKPNPQT